MNYPPNHLGIEQVICWIFNHLNYKVSIVIEQYYCLFERVLLQE